MTHLMIPSICYINLFGKNTFRIHLWMLYISCRPFNVCCLVFIYKAFLHFTTSKSPFQTYFLFLFLSNKKQVRKVNLNFICVGQTIIPKPIDQTRGPHWVTTWLSTCHDVSLIILLSFVLAFNHLFSTAKFRCLWSDVFRHWPQELVFRLQMSIGNWNFTGTRKNFSGKRWVLL